MARATTLWERRMINVRKRKERELGAAVWPDDKLRVIPTHHQSVAHGRQILTFRPTEVIDDPYRIKLMDELQVEYRVVSRAKGEKPKPSARTRPAGGGADPGRDGAQSAHLQASNLTDPDAGTATSKDGRLGATVQYDNETKPEHFDGAVTAVADTTVVHERKPSIEPLKGERLAANITGDPVLTGERSSDLESAADAEKQGLVEEIKPGIDEWTPSETED